MKKSILINLIGQIWCQGPGDHNRGVSKVFDNRDNVHAMLKKLLRHKVNNYDVTASELLSSGCWCQLLSANFINSNRGEPVNALDAACRKWHKCNQCTAIDDGSCLGYQHNYGNAEFDSSSKEYSCPSDLSFCQRNACSCDVALATELADLSGEYDEAYGENFDVAECPTGNGNGTPNRQVDQCCGQYPERFPYASENGIRGCCNGKVSIKIY